MQGSCGGLSGASVVSMASDCLGEAAPHLSSDTRNNSSAFLTATVQRGHSLNDLNP